MAHLFKAMASRLQNLASPAAKQGTPSTMQLPSNLEEIVEGSARVLSPKGAVFYNPAQVVNRDLSVLVLRHHARESKRPLRILEALSATGLRSIRYFKEVPNVSHVIANDMDPSAVAVIRESVKRNGLNPDTQVRPNQGDAAALMAYAAASSVSSNSMTDSPDYGKGGSDSQPFDVVDLDPYGSAAPFLEPAIRCISDGGLLCVTCTDLPVLCGNLPEKCFSRYSSTPLKSPTTHEMAVRIVFFAIQAAANRLGRSVEAVLCAKIDFYVRLFVRVRDSKSLAQRTPSKSAMVFQCGECGTQTIQPMGRCREITVGSSSRRKRRRREGDTDAANGDATPPAGTTTKTTANADGSVEDAAPTQNEDKSQPSKQQIAYKFTPPLVVQGVSPCCGICGGAVAMGGPIWGGSLIGPGVADSLLNDLKTRPGHITMGDRVSAIIRLLDEEVPTVPLFMHLPSMCRTLSSSVPPSAAVRAVLTAKGYEVSQSHVDPHALKTTAPVELVWDILRVWARKSNSSLFKKLDMDMQTEKDGKEEDHTGGPDGDKSNRRSAGERILAREPVLVSADDVDFTVKKDKFVRRAVVGGEKQGVRFPHNPQPNWGPKPRAGGKRQRTED